MPEFLQEKAGRKIEIVQIAINIFIDNFQTYKQVIKPKFIWKSVI